MKKWKKQLSFLMILTMLSTALAACGTPKEDEKGAENATEDQSKDTAKEGEKTEIGDDLVPTEPTEVTFWHSISGDKEIVLKEIVDDYNAGPGAEIGVTVNPIFQGSYDEFSTKLTASLQAGDTENLPDLVQLSSKGIFDVKDSKYIYFVQNLLDKDPNGIDPATFNAASAAYCTYDGDLLGVPFSTSSIMVYYNKDHFTEAGLNPEAPPTTLAELADAVKKLTIKNGDKIERYGLGTRLRFFILGTWVPSLGEGHAMFNCENGRAGTPKEINMTKDGSLETILTEWNKVLATGGVEYTDAAPNESFLSGYYSMMFASTSSLATVLAQTEETGTMNLGVTEITKVNDSSSSATGIGGSALYMFDRANENSILGAWDFIKYLATPEVSAKWYMSTGYYPMNMEAMESEEVKALTAEHPQYEIINTILEHSAGYTNYTEPWIPSFTDTDSLVQDEIIKLSDGSQDIETTIANIETGATQKLNDYNSAN
ncbi:ABC transporter substrate-binding protein [Novisyntrophococcus fermenticellae]|uniref:ABC transporter substrate-binding protein n=1 Tax=Novisyntrophococcus fermenticellae TaxID=2068655 RepID=UPI001E5561F1|nr:ABC transporter substrate-binding protein [Novisyntrophococcus fermenticellae]